MRMITFFILVLITVESVLGDCNCKRDPEPVCSKYDYEEKLLAKTIRLEYRVEEVDKDRNEMETKCMAELEKLTTRVAIQDTTIETIKSNFSTELEKLTTRVAIQDTSIETIKAKFSTELEAMENKTDQLNSRIEEMENRYTNISEEIKQSKGLKAGQRKTCTFPYSYDAGTNLCWKLQRDVNLNWSDAKTECSNQGAHLMILNTTTAFKFMQNYLREVSAGNVFLGASDMAEEGTYKWINGETAQIPWSTNQPNGGTTENCLSIYAYNKYGIFDSNCSSKYELFCQMTV